MPIPQTVAPKSTYIMPIKPHHSPATASHCPSLRLRLPAHAPATHPPLSTGVFGLVLLCLKLDPVPSSGPFPQPFVPPPSSSFCSSFGSQLKYRPFKERVSNHPVWSVFTHHPHPSPAFSSEHWSPLIIILLISLIVCPPSIRMSVPYEEGPWACFPLLSPRHLEQGLKPAHAPQTFVAPTSDDSAGERSGEVMEAMDQNSGLSIS